MSLQAEAIDTTTHEDTPYGGACNALDKEQALLTETVARLRDRLSAFLRPDEPSDGPGLVDALPARIQASATVHLHGVAGRVRFERQQIEDVLDRLDI